MRRFNPSIETNPELSQMLELAHKDIERVVITIFCIFTMLSRDTEDEKKKTLKKIKILGINLMKNVQDKKKCTRSFLHRTLLKEHKEDLEK